MLKSVRYRSDAKLILGIGLVLCALASCVYGILLIPAVKGIKFEWEYLAIIGGVALVFVLISVYLFCRAAAWARKETQEKVMYENPDCAVELIRAGTVVEGSFAGALKVQIPQSINCKERERVARKAPAKINLETVKKVAKVVVPVAVTCIAVAAISTNSQYRKQERRRRQLYRWLG